MKLTGILLMSAMFAAGCSSTPVDNEAAAAEAAKPTFTDEEKAAMTTDEKVAIHNETAKPEDRVVCRRQVVTGSHRKKMVCRTSGQIRQDQDAAAELLRDTVRGAAADPAGGN